MKSPAKEKLITWEQAILWLKSQPDKKQLAKDCYYDDPLLKSAKRFYDSSEWKNVQNLISPYQKGTVLDIGAGRGISSFALAQDGWKVTALEPDSSELVGFGAIIQLAKQARLSIKVINKYGEQLPFKNNSFEAVYCRQVLHHARNLGKLCHEVQRVLKPGGVFLATREHVISKKSDLEAFLKSHPLHYLYGGENAYLLKDYIKAIKTSGLEIVKIFAPYDTEINYFPHTLKDILPAFLVNGNSAAFRLMKRVYISYLNRINNSPGRLYSFICIK